MNETQRSGEDATGDHSSRRERRDGLLTGRELLAVLVDDPCPLPRCSGTLVREAYKGTDAVVCHECAVPAVRVWSDSP